MDRSEDGVLSLKVVLTKSDLGGDVDAAKEVVASMGMSEPMVVSSHDGTGLDELRESIMYSLYGPKRTVIVSQGNDAQRSPEAYVNQIYNTGIVTSKNGFEWENIDQIWNKLHEELEELKDALKKENTAEAEAEIHVDAFELVFQ